MNGSPSTAAQAAWQALRDHAEATMRSAHLRDLFAAEGAARTRLAADGAGLHLDYSKQRVTGETMDLLVALARASGVEARRDAMLAGEPINVTEGRSVLHTALRAPREASLVVDGRDVVADVHEVLDRMGALATAVRDGTWTGATGQRIAAVVNIGIGGSDLGPAMAYRALLAYSDRSIDIRFVSNVDPAEFVEATRDLKPESTLVIVASKTFTTAETMANAALARSWIVSALGDEAVARHFVAVSTNAEAVASFGIDTANMVGFWDWVGGRYSMDSAIGLSTMIAIGPDGFADLLAGFHAMDEHFRLAPLERSLPVLMGMLAVWNRSLLGIPTTAVLPYSHYLSRFPAYLQQLTMESNGKRVRLDGTPVDTETGAVYWGEPGTNGQHSFYQLIHQGTSDIACDVIVFAQSVSGHHDEHDVLAANALAQASVMAFGRTADDVRRDGTPEWLVPHKVMPGNRPSSTIMAARLEPHSLGALVALYEHSVFVQGVVWGIDSFDQWGVELGKRVAVGVHRALTHPDEPAADPLDPSTAALVARYQALSAVAR